MYELTQQLTTRQPENVKALEPQTSVGCVVKEPPGTPAEDRASSNCMMQTGSQAIIYGNLRPERLAHRVVGQQSDCPSC